MHLTAFESVRSPHAHRHLESFHSFLHAHETKRFFHFSSFLVSRFCAHVTRTHSRNKSDARLRMCAVKFCLLKTEWMADGSSVAAAAAVRICDGSIRSRLLFFSSSFFSCAPSACAHSLPDGVI